MTTQIDEVKKALPDSVQVCFTIETRLIQDMTPEEQQHAFREGLLIRGYLDGQFSMGELAESLGLGYEEAQEWIAAKGIPTWRKRSPEIDAIAKKNMRELAEGLNLKLPE